MTLTAVERGGLSAADTLTISPDSTAPTGQSIALAGGPWYTTASVPLTLDDGTDTGAGLDTSSRIVERRTRPSPAAAAARSAPGARSHSTAGADTTVQTGTCYRYRLTIADQVGNASAATAATADAKIDTSAPSAPALTLDETSPNSYARRHHPLLQPAGHERGQLHRHRHQHRRRVRHRRRRLPDRLRHRQHHGQPRARTPPRYTWDDTSTASGDKTVTVTNSAGHDRDLDLHLTPDTTAPAGQAVTSPAAPGTRRPPSPSRSTTAATPAPASTSPRGPSSADSATLTDGACGTFGDWTPVTLTGGADTTVTSGTATATASPSPTRSATPAHRPPRPRAPRSTRSRPTSTVTAPTALTGAGNQHWEAATKRSTSVRPARARSS